MEYMKYTYSFMNIYDIYPYLFSQSCKFQASTTMYSPRVQVLVHTYIIVFRTRESKARSTYVVAPYLDSQRSRVKKKRVLGVVYICTHILHHTLHTVHIHTSSN